MDEIGALYENIQGISNELAGIYDSLEEIGEVEVGELSPSDVGATPVARRRRFRATSAGGTLTATQRKAKNLESRVKDLEQLAKELKVKSKRGAISEAISSAGRDEHEVSQTVAATASTTYQLPKAQDKTRANIAVVYCDAGTISIQDMTHMGNSLFSRGGLNRVISAGKAWAFGFSDRIINPMDDLGAVVSAAATTDKFSVQYLYAEPAIKAQVIAQFCSV